MIGTGHFLSHFYQLCLPPLFLIWQRQFDVSFATLGLAPVVMAVMLETMLLALVGGVIGGALAYLVFNGYGASTMGAVGKLSFELSVTPELLWTGLKWALAIGFVGGLFPAMRAARVPVATALREL